MRDCGKKIAPPVREVRTSSRPRSDRSSLDLVRRDGLPRRQEVAETSPFLEQKAQSRHLDLRVCRRHPRGAFLPVVALPEKPDFVVRLTVGRGDRLLEVAPFLHRLLEFRQETAHFAES